MPIAWISVPTSLDEMIRSNRARSTLRILPFSGRIACVLRSRPCLAEPPAESPLDQKQFGLGGIAFLTIGELLPGRLATLIAPLRLISRARRAASRAAAASITFWMIDLASAGFSSSHSLILSLISDSNGWRTSELTSLSLVWLPNFGSGSFTLTIAVRPSRMSSPDKADLFLLQHPRTLGISC